jgi:predicted transcriptional regulator of viral defense system
MLRTAVGVPPELARRRNKVLRPRDAASVYAHPRAELARLTRTGALRHIATGYYVLSPPDRWADDRWIPDINAAALGLAQVDYGADVALMGISAARHHGAIPRALAVAIVAVPKQRPALDTGAGRIVFVKRDVTRLDIERIDTQLTSGWITTTEQTLVDLAARPTLGGLPEQDTIEAIRALASRVDWDLVQQLARDQRRPSAASTAARLAGESHA